MPPKQIKIKSRINLDLDERYTEMVDYLKEAYGLTFGAELVRVLIKNAYDREKGPYSLKKYEV